MEVPIPEWLNKEFLSDCLQNESKESDVCVEDFQAESAVPPGNNYGSIVVRVRLQYTSPSNPQPSSKSLIVKCPLTSGFLNEFCGDLLDKEFIFYRDYLPKAYQKVKVSYAPKCFPCTVKDVVVLEDLKEAGFEMAEKKDMLDFEQCKQYAIKAAAFHAGSIPVFKQHPELIEVLGTEIMFSNKHKMGIAMGNQARYGVELAADRIFELTGDERKYDIMKKASLKIWDMLIECVKPTGVVNTINQGDPWATNMMFKYNNGSCVDMKILDFQALRYCSPASDLTFFLWCSGKGYVREEKYDEICKIYVQNFNKCLKDAGCEEQLISEKFFKEEMLRMSPIAFWAGFLSLPMVENELVDVDSFFKICGQEYSRELNPYAPILTKEFCKTHFLPLVKQFDQIGVFDHIEKYLAKF